MFGVATGLCARPDPSTRGGTRVAALRQVRVYLDICVFIQVIDCKIMGYRGNKLTCSSRLPRRAFFPPFVLLPGGIVSTQRVRRIGLGGKIVFGKGDGELEEYHIAWSGTRVERSEGAPAELLGPLGPSLHIYYVRSQPSFIHKNGPMFSVEPSHIQVSTPIRSISGAEWVQNGFSLPRAPQWPRLHG